MELLVVVLLIGITAGFALPQYQKSITKATRRNKKIEAIAIHGAQNIYEAQKSTYYLNSGYYNLNSNLNLNLPNDGSVYSCAFNIGLGQTVCSISNTGLGFVITVNLDLDISDAIPNPDCGGNPC